MSEIDTSGKALVDHWRWAADKGLMNANSAGSLRVACLQVLSTLDDWEGVDVTTLDLDDVFRRFRNKRSRDFKPASLNTYQQRFVSAVRMFLEYVNDPAKWRPPVTKERTAHPIAKQLTDKSKANSRSNVGDQPADAAQASRTERGRERNPDLVDFPFPLRDGLLVVLCLPADLKWAEVARLTAYMKSIAVDPPMAE